MAPLSTPVARALGGCAWPTLGVAALAVAAYVFIVADGAGFGVPVSALQVPRWLVMASIDFVAASISSIVGAAFSAIVGAVMRRPTRDGGITGPLASFP